jgi:hypothetical protein
VSHLDAASLEALLKNPAAYPELRAHLLQGCAHCEALVAAHSDAALDGATDQGLLAVSQRPRKPDRDDRFSTRRVKLPLRKRRWTFAAVAAAAAVLIGGVGVSFRLRVANVAEKAPTAHDGDDGVKGPRLLTVALSAVHRAPDGALTRVEDGQRVPAHGELLLRYQASEAAQVRVTLVRENGRREELGPVELNAGLNDLPVGVSLEGEQGRLDVELGVARLTVQVEP